MLTRLKLRQLPKIKIQTLFSSPAIRPPNPSTTSLHNTYSRKMSTPATSPPAAPPPRSAWDTPGPSTSDFRSDVVTTPTAAMLAAIRRTTLGDDVYEEDSTTRSLESFMAALTGHAAALLVTSGTMGNQLALRTHLAAPPYGVVCDARAHVVQWEGGGAATLSGAVVVGVRPANGRYLTVRDVAGHAQLDEDVHLCPTRVVSLENTCDGTVLPLLEARRISEWCRERGIRVHLDGARLWEAVAAGAGGLKEYCQLADTVSLCFSKGLGAPIGSILVGSENTIKKARHFRKIIGGGMRQAGVIAAPARVAVEDTFLGGKLAACHTKAKDLGKFWTGLGGKLQEPVETNMVWIDVKSSGISTDELIAKGLEKGIKLSGGRFVIHYQINDDSITKLKDVLKSLMKNNSSSTVEVARL